jgi:hypothetical protein
VDDPRLAWPVVVRVVVALVRVTPTEPAAPSAAAADPVADLPNTVEQLIAAYAVGPERTTPPMTT